MSSRLRSARRLGRSYRRRIAPIMLIVLGLLLFVAPPAYADIELRVTVTDCTGRPIEGALVEVPTSDTGIGGAAVGITDADGQVTISPVRPGPMEHTVLASADGYESAAETKNMEADSTQTIEFKLTPTSGTCAEPPSSTQVDATSPSVDPPPLARIDVTPSEVSLNLGDNQQFQAKGFDAEGNEVSLTPVWSANGGPITTGGLYTGTTPGDFTVTATAEDSTVAATAAVSVDPPPLARIDVTPAEVSLNLGDNQQFQAKGYDAQGNEIPITPGWSTNGGPITTGGLYTGTTPGDFTVTANVQGTTVTGTASFSVEKSATVLWPWMLIGGAGLVYLFVFLVWYLLVGRARTVPVWPWLLAGLGLLAAMALLVLFEGRGLSVWSWLLLGAAGLVLLVFLLFWMRFLGRGRTVPIWPWLLPSVASLLLIGFLVSLLIG